MIKNYSLYGYALWFLILFTNPFVVNAQNTPKSPDFVKFINTPHKWVDSVYNSLSPKERIAQLFLVRAHTDLGQKYIDSVGRIIQKEQLGGLVVFQGGPVRHANMFNNYQQKSKVPLLVTFDGEWGLGMRLKDSTISYPYQMTLGAIQGNELIYEMGRHIAKDFKRIGMHFNFAPVIDINNNSKNPVINFRSFGDDKINVTQKAKAYMQGMVDEGIISSLKHFPGHGDTDVDSHYDLPKLDFSMRRLRRLEMYPFEKLIQDGAPAIMVAHMHIPAMDNTPNIPSSISKKVVTGILRDELGFKGLSVTDAMDMKGVTKFFPNGEADVMAIEAGNDLLELSQNSSRAISMIQNAIKEGRIKQSDIDSRVKRVLAAKYWLGLDHYRPAPTKNLVKDLNADASKKLVQRLADASITVLKSRRALNAFNFTKPTLVVSVGISKSQHLENALLKKLTNKKHLFLNEKESADAVNAVLEENKNYEQTVLLIHDNRARPRSTLDYNDEVRKGIQKLSSKKAIAIVHANPYVLSDIDVDKCGSIIIGYQNEEFMQKSSAKVLLKEIRSFGKLPVTVSKKYRFGDGF